MSRRGIGISFMAIAAFLFESRYITAAIYHQGVSRDNGNYEQWLDFMGTLPKNLSIILATIGILYLIWGEYEIAYEKANGRVSWFLNTCIFVSFFLIAMLLIFLR